MKSLDPLKRPCDVWLVAFRLTGYSPPQKCLSGVKYSYDDEEGRGAVPQTCTGPQYAVLLQVPCRIYTSPHHPESERTLNIKTNITVSAC